MPRTLLNENKHQINDLTFDDLFPEGLEATTWLNNANMGAAVICRFSNSLLKVFELKK